LIVCVFVTVVHKHLFNRLYSFCMKNSFSSLSLNRRQILGAVVAAAVMSSAGAVWAVDEAPEAFIKRITNETLDIIKADKALRNGDVNKLTQLVDDKLMPHVNFRRMTSLATGPAWRKATPEQQKRLQDEFKILLVRTYAGALSQVSDQVVVVKPLRPGQEDKNLVVNTEVRGKGDPIQLDYRLEKTAGEGAGWMIFDLNVLGVWLIENYRTQFTKEINAGGIDALITSLVARNKSNARNS
jgi:phospholipid transport system substrate-binding protein